MTLKNRGSYLYRSAMGFLEGFNLSDILFFSLLFWFSFLPIPCLPFSLCLKREKARLFSVIITYCNLLVESIEKEKMIIGWFLLKLFDLLSCSEECLWHKICVINFINRLNKNWFFKAMLLYLSSYYLMSLDILFLSLSSLKFRN